MREKLLSISVAVYKVEAYLSQCLESCCVPEVVDALEVLVIDDGSPDSSADIAQSFVERYPDTFRLIRKENGGYGTTVNTSMKLATGKYFKILDGDDWFDREGLIALVDALADSEADWVITPRFISRDGGAPIQNAATWSSHIEQTLPMEEIDFDFFPSMWQLTVKTSLLKEHPFELPERISYTDQIFVTRTLSWAKNVLFLEKGVYCYRVGREGQTVELSVRLKNMDQLLSVINNQVDYFEQQKAHIDKGNRRLSSRRIASSYANIIKTLLTLPINLENRERIITLDENLRNRSSEIFDATSYHRRWIKILRSLGYTGYWGFRFIDMADNRYWMHN